MSVSVSHATIGSFEVSLAAFAAILDKAVAHAEVKKFDPNIYVTMRLRPDMLSFASQVQTFCDHAKKGSARLAGVEPPRYEDNETTIAELKARVLKTLEYIKSLDHASVDQGATRDVVVPVGPNMKLKMVGANYLMHFLLPNFYFHLVTAYDLLRFAGVEIGKRDFLGAVPGATQV